MSSLSRWIKGCFWTISGSAIAPLLMQSAIAQIIPDNTLPTNSSVVPGCTACIINGGTERGVNLYHSFKEFSIPTAGSAWFNNAPQIQNILTRVTGNSISNIDGLIKANGTANLFLLNPNGILFGQNARLQIGGSFFASTASSFKFPDGSEFSATNPQAPPLLTVNIAPGLQTGRLTTGATIANRGNLTAGQDLILEATHLDLQGQLVAGRDLTLKAWDSVTIRDTITTPFLAQSGRNLTIQGNRNIDIWALNHPGAALQSGSHLTLISDGAISGDAHFASNGRFSVLTLQGKPGTLVSKYDPIISVNGDAILGNYTGASLKVEATGNIQIGNVSITAPDVGLTGTDPDIPILTSGSALILRAGVSQLANPANFVSNQQYSILNLGTLGGGYSYAYAINNEGQVVGASTDATGYDHAYRTAPNAAINPLTDNLGTLGGLSSFGYGINDSGQVVGATYDAAGNFRAFRTAPNAAINPLTDNLGTLGGGRSTAADINDAGQVGGDATDVAGNNRAIRTVPNALINPLTDNLGTLGNFSTAQSINNTGQVVGYSFNAAGNRRAFRTAANAAINPLTDNLGTLGGNDSIAYGINAASQVVGYATDAAGNRRAFRTTANAAINPLTDNLGTLGGNDSVALGINTAGQVVGGSADATGNGRAFLFDNGFMIDLNTRILSSSGWTLIDAFAINDTGQIAGNGLLGGQGLGFLLTPLPVINAVGSGTLTVGSISQAVGDPLTVILAAKSDVQTGSIDTTGGDIRIASGATFRTTDSIFRSDSISSNAGNITIQANAVAFTNSLLLSGSASGNAGNIAIQANSATFTTSRLNSGTAGIGNAGDITIQSTTVDLLNGSNIIAGTLGTGTGGNVAVTAANTLTLAGVDPNGLPSQIVTNTLGSGNAGEIQITAGNLIVQDGAAIASTVESGGTGQGGNTTINADSILVSGTTPDGVFPSRIATATFSSGDAGALTVNTRQLTVQDGALISTASVDPGATAGRSGNLTLNATESILLSGTSTNGQSLSSLSTDTFGSGAAEDLRVNTRQLTVRDGAAVSVSTFGSAQGGRMIVNASDLIDLSGTAANGFASGLYAQAFGSGNAGDLQVNTGQLNVRDRATITVASGSTADTRVPTGQPNFTFPINLGAPGNAGTLTIQANNILLDRQGKLLASTASGEGGNINLTVRDILLMRRNSLISATAGTALAGGDGGNIRINAGFIVGVLSENSDITANAFTGRGGNITITTNGIFGLKFQPKLTPFSDITASSQFGVNGTVTLNLLNVDPSRGLVALPINLTDPSQQISQDCKPGSKTSASSFITTGRGGIPLSPDEPLESRVVVTKWVPLPEDDGKEGRGGEARTNQSKIQNSPKIPAPFVEAQGVTVGTDGKMELVANKPAGDRANSWVATPRCPTSYGN